MSNNELLAQVGVFFRLLRESSRHLAKSYVLMRNMKKRERLMKRSAPRRFVKGHLKMNHEPTNTALLILADKLEKIYSPDDLKEAAAILRTTHDALALMQEIVSDDPSGKIWTTGKAKEAIECILNPQPQTNEQIARDIVHRAILFSGPDHNTYVMDLITTALNAKDQKHKTCPFCGIKYATTITEGETTC